MTWIDDDELAVRFRELRDDDETNAPGFRTVVGLAQGRAAGLSRRMRDVWWVAAAAGVVLTAGIAVRRAEGSDRILLVARTAEDSFEAGPISTWSSPTAPLLRSADPLLHASRSVSTSVLDAATRGAHQLQGDGK